MATATGFRRRCTFCDSSQRAAFPIWQQSFWLLSWYWEGRSSISFVSSCFSWNSLSGLTGHLPASPFVFSPSFPCVPSKFCILSTSELWIWSRSKRQSEYIGRSWTISLVLTPPVKTKRLWSDLCHLTFLWQVPWIHLILRLLRLQKHNRCEPFHLRPCATNTNNKKSSVLIVSPSIQISERLQTTPGRVE